MPRASKKAVGLQGENRMRHVLDDNLDEKDYVIMHDVLLPGLYGMPTQIDHLVISRYGIFVIEMKNWLGDIVARTTKWLKCRGRRQQKLTNPIRQNAKHMHAFSERLNVPERLIYGFVAVPPEAQFAAGMPKDVHYYSDIPNVILGFQEPVIKPEQVPEIAVAVREWCATISEKERKNFTKKLKVRYREADAL